MTPLDTYKPYVRSLWNGEVSVMDKGIVPLGQVDTLVMQNLGYIPDESR
jgi:hypothetical protein